VLPLKMGDDKIPRDKHIMGDKYGTVFSESWKARNNLVKIDLSDNR